LVLFRRRQELGTPGTPFGVHGLDVFDPDIEEAADPVGIAWRLQDDRRLVVGRASAGIASSVSEPAGFQPTFPKTVRIAALAGSVDASTASAAACSKSQSVSSASASRP
jgi:hypothetical protein